LLEDKEQLEDYLILNLNKALNRAADIYDKSCRRRIRGNA
jgi:DNA-binding protein YbaB